MPQIRISGAAGFLGVSDDTLRRWIASGELTAQTDSTGKKVVDGAELAQFARERSAQLPTPAGGSSARNRFMGLVTAVTSDKVMSQVELQCGPYRVVSLISTEAVRSLGLEPGVVATASIKATNVVIDRPEA
ncbi:TOBE domain-containing protein [Nesterenkonia ebinurensis]|uniref:TOBE domain-containing protein n=1 Tax=Nesterenkonia ebinurensis TaxID=2608252 RepID=UPI00123D5FD5|nr:TOBE domain-containing protein [Nesterenkonia ebinurensis]